MPTATSTTSTCVVPAVGPPLRCRWRRGRRSRCRRRCRRRCWAAAAPLLGVLLLQALEGADFWGVWKLHRACGGRAAQARAPPSHRARLSGLGALCCWWWWWCCSCCARLLRLRRRAPCCCCWQHGRLRLHRAAAATAAPGEPAAKPAGSRRAGAGAWWTGGQGVVGGQWRRPQLMCPHCLARDPPLECAVPPPSHEGGISIARLCMLLSTSASESYSSRGRGSSSGWRAVCGAKQQPNKQPQVTSTHPPPRPTPPRAWLRLMAREERRESSAPSTPPSARSRMEGSEAMGLSASPPPPSSSATSHGSSSSCAQAHEARGTGWEGMSPPPSRPVLPSTHTPHPCAPTHPPCRCCEQRWQRPRHRT